MSVNYNTPTLTARLQQVVAAIDGGGAAGRLRLLDSSANILSSFTLSVPSATVAGNILTFSGLSLIDPSAAASGAAVAARIENSNGTAIISGLTVSNIAGADIVLSPTNNIVAGQAVAITAATIQGN